MTDQPAPHAPPGTPYPARRHAAHDGHHRQRPAPRDHRRTRDPGRLALPLRTRPALPALAAACAAWWLHATRPQWWALLSSHAAGGRLVARAFGGRMGLPGPDRAAVCRVRRARHRRMARRRDRGRAVHVAPAAGPHPRRPGAVGAVVGASAPARQGPRRAQARSLARDRQGRGPAWLTGHVRRGGRVGLAVAASGWHAARPSPTSWRRFPALESALGTFRGAIRVYPTPDDLANRCELRVLDIDPHAGAIPWPGPSVTSITEPIDLGPFEDAAPCRVLFLRRHGLVGRQHRLGQERRPQRAHRQPRGLPRRGRSGAST